MRRRRVRAFLIVLVLGIGGGAVAGVLGMLLVALGVLVYSGPFPLPLAPFAIGASVGAMCGAVLGPLLGFSILRHVPLGRAIGWCMVGALAGVALALVLGGPLVLVTAPLGMLVAAIVLYERQERALKAHAGIGSSAERSRPPAA